MAALRDMLGAAARGMRLPEFVKAFQTPIHQGVDFSREDSMRPEEQEPEKMGSKAFGAAPFPIPWLTPYTFWNPNLDTGTEGAGQTRELHDALRDAKAAACFDLRNSVSASLPWEIIGQENTPPEVTDFVKQTLDNLNMVELIEEMSKASYFGISPIEVFWGYDKKNRLIPSRFVPFDFYYLAFDGYGNLFVQGKEPPTGKVIIHKHGGQYRNPYGLGRGRTVPRWVRVKTALAYALYRDVPRYLHDKLHFAYPNGASTSDVNEYAATVEKVLDDSALLTPASMTATPIRLESNFEVAQSLLDAIDAQIALAILGNTLTTGEGRGAGIGSGSQSKAHSKSEDKQTWSDAKRIEATLNQTVIRWIVEANFPDAVPPRINFDATVRPDVTERIDMLTKLGSMKRAEDGEPFQFSERWLRETFNVPAPDSEDDAEKDEKKGDAFVFVAPTPAPLGGEKELEDKKDPEEKKSEKLSAKPEDPLEVWGGQFATRFAGVYRMIGKTIMEHA